VFFIVNMVGRNGGRNNGEAYPRIAPKIESGDFDSSDITFGGRLVALATSTAMTHTMIANKLDRLWLAVDMYRDRDYNRCMKRLNEDGKKVNEDPDRLYVALRSVQISLETEIERYKDKISQSQNSALKRSYFDPADFAGAMKGPIDSLSENLSEIGKKLDVLEVSANVGP